MISRLLDNSDPIIGLATNLDRVSAIAILRISGPIEPADFAKVLSINIKGIKPRFQHFTKIVDGKTVLDEVLFTFFKGPNSFTGENCFEISLHGNPINVNRIINYLVDHLKLRKAEAGEFTLRAYRNKKLDMTQVEGLDSFLHAQTLSALDSSMMALNGSIHDSFLKLKDDFISLKTAIELNIDFSEDIGEIESELKLKEAASVFNETFKKLYNKVNLNPESLRTPIVSLLGGVNAGKSTFFNSILAEDRAIVSNIKGTTRDFISETFYIKNQPYKLIDTAGLRESKDEIETEGIKRSKEIARDSFFRILILNPNERNWEEDIESMEFDLTVFTHMDKFNQLPIELGNLNIKSKSFLFADQLNNKFSPIISGSMGPEKSGSMGPEKSGSMGPEKSGSMGPEKSGSMGPEKSGSMGPEKSGSMGPEKSGSMGPISIAVVFQQNQGVSFTSGVLSDRVFPLFCNKFNDLSKGQEIIIDRHIHALSEIHSTLCDFNGLINNGIDIGLISQLSLDLQTSIEHLIGIYSSEDMLNNIFSNFCIGK